MDVTAVKKYQLGNTQKLKKDENKQSVSILTVQQISTCLFVHNSNSRNIDFFEDLTDFPDRLPWPDRLSK